MPRGKSRRGPRSKPQVPRIRPPEAEQILEQCREILALSGDLFDNLRSTGLGPLLARLDERVLQLALQPDSWGEQTRALLISEAARAFHKQPEVEHTDDFLEASNTVMPCILLEIGQRKQHIFVEFPSNPSGPNSCIKLRLGPSHPVHTLNAAQLTRLVAAADEALVGLCYFGDHDSRTTIEIELARD